MAIDVTYTFTIADTVGPTLVSAAAQDKDVVQVTFSEPVKALSADGADDALNPANYSFERLSAPAVALTATRVEAVSATTYDIFTDFIHSFGASYSVTANNVADVSDNPIATNNVQLFTGFEPIVPEGRDFQLVDLIPQHSLRIDDTMDLQTFLGLLQDALDVVLCLIDRWTDILDPDRVSGAFLDGMLCHLGNPFNFELTEAEKRRLLAVLIPIYQKKGTVPGVVDAVFFFLGIEVQIIPLNDFEDGWILGESELGIDTRLFTGNSRILYSFEVIAPVGLTDEQRERMIAVIDYMKPIHEHIARINAPTIPTVETFWILGESELGVDTNLSQ